MSKEEDNVYLMQLPVDRGAGLMVQHVRRKIAHAALRFSSQGVVRVVHRNNIVSSFKMNRIIAFAFWFFFFRPI